mgnify:CR=1 FL=1|tara:strand:- start:180 stop:794 length:615 start_codon:yes stop_codon:yes gene_type:complete
MDFINKLKKVAGIKVDKKNMPDEKNQYEILNDDSLDVVFAKKLIQNNGRFFYCDTKDHIIKTMQALTKKLNTNLIYCTEKILQELLSKSKIDYTDTDYLTCNTILTSCEYLIAHQGKIMLSSKQLGPNDIKNLPKEHIIIAYTSQIVKNLNDAMSGVNTRYIDNLPSTITTITSDKESQTTTSEGHLKNLSILLIEDFQNQKLI